jgi:hypothetical protein
MTELKVRIATRPFMGRVGTLAKSGKCIVLDDSNVILLARWYKFYPATI